MEWIGYGLGIFALSGLGAWMVRGRSAIAPYVGAIGCVTAGAMGVYGVILTLISQQIITRRSLWNMPYGSLSLGMDGLSALFLLPVFLIGGIIAFAGIRTKPGTFAAERPREYWLYYSITLAGAGLALTARNAVVFLFAWETMTVASFLLVENGRKREGGRGGWVYLVAGHIGGACLFAMFSMLADGGVMDFHRLSATGAVAGAVFVLGCVGFGGKMGMFPFHAWYPEGYADTPASTGALLSGVVGNMGLYGLVRMILLLADQTPPPLWWGVLLVVCGLASGLIGAARSMASLDLTRLLAWSSLDNFGLMTSGIGLGLIGMHFGSHLVAVTGFTGALLHMLNHAVCKSLAFLAAENTATVTGTNELDRMGGWLKSMPYTGGMFLLAVLGAAAVPPFTGFSSEFLMLLSAFYGAAGGELTPPVAALMICAIVAMAIVAGLAAAAGIKAFAFIFLGAPRVVSGDAENKADLPPLAILALLAAGLVIAVPPVIRVVRPVADAVVRSFQPMELARQKVPIAVPSLVQNGVLLLAACLGAVWVLRRLFRRGGAGVPTWDCGYAAPDHRMQYTASSFVAPLRGTFAFLTGATESMERPNGVFPKLSRLFLTTSGIESSRGFPWLFRVVSYLAGRLRLIQHGQVQMYIWYMAAVLVALLLWKL